MLKTVGKRFSVYTRGRGGMVDLVQEGRCFIVFVRFTFELKTSLVLNVWH